MVSCGTHSWCLCPGQGSSSIFWGGGQAPAPAHTWPPPHCPRAFLRARALQSSTHSGHCPHGCFAGCVLRLVPSLRGSSLGGAGKLLKAGLSPWVTALQLRAAPVPTSGCRGQTPAGAGGSAAAPLKGVTGDDRGEKIKLKPSQTTGRMQNLGARHEAHHLFTTVPAPPPAGQGWLLARRSGSDSGQKGTRAPHPAPTSPGKEGWGRGRAHGCEGQLARPRLSQRCRVPPATPTASAACQRLPGRKPSKRILLATATNEKRKQKAMDDAFFFAQSSATQPRVPSVSLRRSRGRDRSSLSSSRWGSPPACGLSCASAWRRGWGSTPGRSCTGTGKRRCGS